jgi:small subunit ribosomal protein S3
LGRKVHPLGFRLGVIRDWQARWYADKLYAEFLQEDLKLRKAIVSAYPDAAISQVLLERQANEVFITIHTARPGIVIGRGGQRVDETRARLERLIGKRVRLNIQEVAQPELDSYLVARTVADQMEHRIAYRRAMKQALFRTTQAGAKGMKITCSGRLGGNEIARRESMHQGRVPLHTLRADIDYGFTEARTTLGRIGVKVWIYKGEILPEPKVFEVEEVPAEEITAETEGIPTTAEVTEAPEKAPPVAEAPAETVEPEAVEAPPVAEAPAEPVEPEAVEAPPVAEAPAETVKTEAVEAPPVAEAPAETVEPEAVEAPPAAEAPAETVKTEAAEAPPAAEEKPVKPRTRKKKTADTDEAEGSKAKPKKSKVTEAKPPAAEEEQTDVAAQEGEISQDS